MATTKTPQLRIFKQTPQGELKLHLFAPDDTPSCAVVFFMCGSWKGFHAPKFYPQSAYLAGRGALALVAEVRTISRHGTSPRECVIDAKSAVRWVRVHAGELGFPANRVVAAGGSAAGHVSLAIATIADFDEDEDRSVSCVPDLVCAYNPAVLPNLDECTSTPERIQLRIEKFGSEQALMALSPMRAVRPGLPPTLLMTGDADEVTPLADTELFAKRMAEDGNDCRLKVYPGGRHGFFNYRAEGNAYFTQTTNDVDRFLGGFGFLSGEPTIEAFKYNGPT